MLSDRQLTLQLLPCLHIVKCSAKVDRVCSILFFLLAFMEKYVLWFLNIWLLNACKYLSWMYHLGEKIFLVQTIAIALAVGRSHSTLQRRWGNRILISQIGKLRPTEGTRSSQVHVGISRVRNRVMIFEGYVCVLLTTSICWSYPEQLHNEKQLLTCNSLAIPSISSLLHREKPWNLSYRSWLTKPLLSASTDYMPESDSRCWWLDAISLSAEFS